jgi:hypothetical protein
MTLRIIGAGLPRTGTASLRLALEQLIGGKSHHMSVIPGHPFDLGEGWDTALSGGTPDWNAIFEGYTTAVDWPASMFWREISAACPDALILLSTRDSAETWVQSVEATFMKYARMAQAPDWSQGRGLAQLMERFAGNSDWDDREVLMAAHDCWNADVRATAPSDRLIDMCAADGWEPLCRALGVPVPDAPFPWVNRREDWD